MHSIYSNVWFSFGTILELIIMVIKGIAIMYKIN